MTLNHVRATFLLSSRDGRNASRDDLVKLGWVHCLQYTLNCFQYNVCGLCRCEPSNHQLTLHNVIFLLSFLLMQKMERQMSREITSSISTVSFSD